MNEFELYLAGDEPGQRGYRRVLAGPEHPAHGNFGPGAGIGLGYDDLKVIEANEFLKSVATGVQGEPGFAHALAVARVQAAMALPTGFPTMSTHHRRKRSHASRHTVVAFEKPGGFFDLFAMGALGGSMHHQHPI